MSWFKRSTGKKESDKKAEPQRIPTPPSSKSDLFPDLPNYNPESADGVRVGESPVPGLTLKRILRGHTEPITRMSWSPDGRFLASPSHDNTIRIWEIKSGKCVTVLKGHEAMVNAVTWKPDGRNIFSASNDKTVREWDAFTGELLATFVGHENAVEALAWLPSGNLVSADRKQELIIWNLDTGNVLATHPFGAVSFAQATDGVTLAIAPSEGILCLWDTITQQTIRHFGEKDFYFHVILGPEQHLIVAAEALIIFWDINTGQKVWTLEGHTNSVVSISLSADGKLLSSKSTDGTVRIWEYGTWKTVAILKEPTSYAWGQSLAFHPNLPILATFGDAETAIRIWDIDESVLLAQKAHFDSVRYTASKLVLVGDSGVGKTGLGWRLSHGEFKEHPSTHGQQFWVVDELSQTRADGTQCEAVLWDLAGQDIYRSTHALFLDDVDLSLLLFDPTKGQESLKGIEFWLQQLAGKHELPPSLLVGARVDVGQPILTRDELEQFCQRFGISGGYIGTSAKTGEGLDDLMAILKTQIPWDKMTTTVTTVTFKRIKDYVLSLKEQPDRQNVLVGPADLRAQLHAADSDWEFSDAELMTAVGHLATHGYVTVLRSSSGEKTILLAPDLLVDLVASIILEASKHPRALGSLSETALLRGEYDFGELTGLTQTEREVLLDAAVLRFLEHNICFRETLGAETLLIFPSLIRQKRPLYDDIEATDDVSYIVRGAVENVYAALVVLLGYTQTFTRVNQWQNQAQYEMGAGEICGFRQIEERAGEIEIILYYAPTTPTYVRPLFQGLFEKFLYQRDVEVTRYPPVYCKNKHLQERTSVIKILRQGKRSLFCPECGEKVMLPKVEEALALGERDRKTVAREEQVAELRRTYEMHLLRVKAFRRDRAAPRCYVSHLSSQASWVSGLVTDLRDAGVHVLEDVTQVGDNDFILLAATTAYKQAWQSLDQTFAADIDMIQKRMKMAGQKPLAVVPLLIDGDLSTSCPQELREVRPGDFRNETRRAVELYDLVLTLYAIRFNHPAFESLRQHLHQQWKNTLAETGEVKREVFISYAWGGESEKMVNQLDSAFQDRGVTIVRDKRDLGFRGRIKSFMDEIGEGKCVILVISEKYLKSSNCCYELVQVAKYGDFYDRIFPVVLEDAKIYDPMDRIRYVNYWEHKQAELDETMKTVSSANLEGFRDDIDLYTEIRSLLPQLMDILKDMNTLTPEMHRQSDFTELFEAVMDRLEIV